MPTGRHASVSIPMTIIRRKVAEKPVTKVAQPRNGQVSRNDKLLTCQAVCGAPDRIRTCYRRLTEP